MQHMQQSSLAGWLVNAELVLHQQQADKTDFNSSWDWNRLLARTGAHEFTCSVDSQRTHQ
jgi:hypothetical protein